MASFNKFEDFVEQLLTAKHNFTASGDVFKVYASNATPSASADAFKADLAEITAENGYPSGGSDVQNTLSETGGTATVAGTDVVWTASGGSFGPLRYIVLYNDTMTTPSADGLVGWWDYGSSPTVLTGETFTVDFGASILTCA
jgi:hypothetical protein